MKMLDVGTQGRVLWGCTIALLTGWAVFILPFRFPSSLPVSQSTAYLYGAGNAPAEIGAALLSVAVALAAYAASRRTLPLEAAAAVPPRWLGWAMTVHAVVLLTLGAGMVRLPQAYGESQYFLMQLTKGLAGGQVLYRDVAFAYGPLLYDWPLLWMRGLGWLQIRGEVAYVLAVVLAQLGGLALLFWMVRALPMRPGLQRLAFVLVAFGSLSPTLGVNYCLVRFLAAPAAAMLMARQTNLARAAAATAAAMLLTLGVSAECGVALLGGACALAGLHLLREGWAGTRWLALPAAALAAAAVFAATVGAAMFRMIAQAGRGGYDLLLTPEPRTLLFLTAAVGLAAVAAARGARSGLPVGAPIVAMYGVSLGMIPVALGRADAVHEYFFGLPAALLSLVALDGAGTGLRLPARAWVGALVLWTAGSQAANEHLYWPRLRGLARLVRPDGHGVAPAVDVAALEAQLHGERVFVQYPIQVSAQRQLARDGLLAPAFYAGFSSVWSEAPTERIVREMRSVNYALVAEDGMANDDEIPNAVVRWQRLGLPYRQVHSRFDPGLVLDRELRDHWQRVAVNGETALYRRIS